MPREHKTYLRDILQSIEKINKYTMGINYDQFVEDQLKQDAVIRNLEIIGEAVKHVPLEIREIKPHLEWKKIAGIRDMLIHAYFSVDTEIVWDVIQQKLPELKREVLDLLDSI